MDMPFGIAIGVWKKVLSQENFTMISTFKYAVVISERTTGVTKTVCGGSAKYSTCPVAAAS
jgi:hypothetical protein